MQLIFLGDLILSGIGKISQVSSPADIWGDTLPILSKSDGVFANLECVISDTGKPASGKAFVLRAKPQTVHVLKTATISAVSLANNHTLDYGFEALAECQSILRVNHIAYSGAGITLHDASKPSIIKVANNKTLAFYSCTDNEPTWAARAHRPGVFFVPMHKRDPRFLYLVQSIKSIRHRVDLVILSIHWGMNWGDEPQFDHQDCARSLVAEGVDVIYGHSSHVTRGVEIFKGKPIFYSCGDFLTPLQVDDVERNNWSYIFNANFKGNVLQTITLIPAITEYGRVRLAGEYERDLINNRMARLCRALGTNIEKSGNSLLITK